MYKKFDNVDTRMRKRLPLKMVSTTDKKHFNGLKTKPSMV
jgi:hypothetical protein